jgi:Tfp pilus assembly protein PilF
MESAESANAMVTAAAAECDAGRIEAAVDLARRATEIDPRSAVALRILAVALVRAQRWEEAKRATARLVELLPEDAAAHHQHGDAAAWTRDWPAAEAALRRAVALQPDLAGAWARLANVYRAQTKLEEAIDANEHAAAIAPAPDVLSNLADAYITAGRPDDAIAPLDRALAADPHHPVARINLGCARMRQNRTADAIGAFESVLSRGPDFAPAHFYLALALLKTGDFERGWREFEWRFALSPNSRAGHIRQKIPPWSGGPLDGKSILLFTEQGFGDAIQFARYIPLVAARNPARVIVAAKPALHQMLASVEGIGDLADIVNITAPLPSADLCCAFMSLPLMIGTTLQTIPAKIPYIAAPTELIETWRAKLTKARGLKVGLAWAGSPTNTLDRYRSCRLEELRPIIDATAAGAGHAGISLCSLQKGPGSEQLRDHPTIVDATAELNDWADTAALVANLDLVIAVDTAVVHLAGALGKPVWAMVSAASEWRWLQDRTDSPWYPTMRLFRQDTLHDWTGVARRVAHALRQWK